MQRFKIHLKKAHEESGLTAYAVAKETGLSPTTVAKYVNEDGVIVDYIPMTIVILADFYNLNWREAAVIETFTDVDEGPDDQGQQKTPQRESQKIPA
jgi:DNA transposition AAA+ family ATPase